MAPMKPQPVTDDSFTEAEAIRMVRGLGRPGEWRPAGPPADQKYRHAVLTNTVENEVIPRLLSAQRLKQLADLGENPGTLPHGAVEQLVSLVTDGSLCDAQRFVEALHAGGIPAPRLLMDLLAPTARRLGEMWADDTCSFMDVTTGVLRLGNVMRMLGAAMETQTGSTAAPRLLLFQAPGEQHGFGLAMVAYFFRAAGFNVRNETAITAVQAIELVGGEWFSLVGISVACAANLNSLPNLFAALRHASKNPAIGILAGGFAFLGKPECALEIGADLPALNGPEAVREAQHLISRLARSP